MLPVSFFSPKIPVIRWFSDVSGVRVLGGRSNVPGRINPSVSRTTAELLFCGFSVGGALCVTVSRRIGDLRPEFSVKKALTFVGKCLKMLFGKEQTHLNSESVLQTKALSAKATFRVCSALRLSPATAIHRPPIRFPSSPKAAPASSHLRSLIGPF